MAKLINLVGKTFGRLKVISLAYRKKKRIHWQCLCECGKTTFVMSASLHQKNTQSCGCLRMDKIVKHGLSYVREHHIWGGMKSRCLNENDNVYAYYGGRGITICERWAESYENFIEDMGPAPSLKHSIDRIRNNEGYCKDNCKWSTRVEQCNNRRSNLFITYQGDTKTLSQWCKELNLQYSMVYRRIKASKLDINIAFGTYVSRAPHFK